MEDATSKHLTTGEIAKLYGISARLVCQWIDKGMLQGWKIPGSRDRRVAWGDMIAFSAKHGLKPIKPQKILYVELREGVIYPKIVAAFLRLMGMNAEVVHCLPGAENFALSLEEPTAVIVNVDVTLSRHLDILVKHCQDSGVPLLAVTVEMTLGQAAALERRGVGVLRL